MIYLWILCIDGFIMLLFQRIIVLTTKYFLTISVMSLLRLYTKHYNDIHILGFNIWNVIFDCSGGVLSLLQLYFDCLDMNDFSGILGNWAKLVLQ